MRNLKKSKTITELASAEKLPLQVVRLTSMIKNPSKKSITKIVTEKERIDVLVNNAGYGLFGFPEDLSIEEMKAQFETNFFRTYTCNTTSSSYHEKAEIWHHSKCKLCRRAYWPSYIVCVSK